MSMLGHIDMISITKQYIGSHSDESTAGFKIVVQFITAYSPDSSILGESN